MAMQCICTTGSSPPVVAADQAGPSIQLLVDNKHLQHLSDDSSSNCSAASSAGFQVTSIVAVEDAAPPNPLASSGYFSFRDTKVQALLQKQPLSPPKLPDTT